MRYGDLSARMEVPRLHPPCNLSIVEVEIQSGNVEHSDANGVESVLLENVISRIFTFPEWISTSTMDRSHGEWRLGTSVLVTEVSRSATLRLILVGVRERCSLSTTSSQEFEWPKKQYHSCGALSDTWHLLSRLGWIQLPSRCYPCSRRGGYWTSVNLHTCVYNQM